LICFSKTQNPLKSLSYIKKKQVYLVAYLVGWWKVNIKPKEHLSF
jgi:hypothetical protein